MVTAARGSLSGSGLPHPHRARAIATAALSLRDDRLRAPRWSRRDDLSHEPQRVRATRPSSRRCRCGSSNPNLPDGDAAAPSRRRNPPEHRRKRPRSPNPSRRAETGGDGARPRSRRRPSRRARTPWRRPSRKRLRDRPGRRRPVRWQPVCRSAAATTGRCPGIPSDFHFAYYVQRMLALIESRWYKPAAPAETRALVRFTINRDGRVSRIELESSSGNSSFDRAALRALYAANPLPPLPPAYSKPSLTVHLTFSE